MLTWYQIYYVSYLRHIMPAIIRFQYIVFGAKNENVAGITYTLVIKDHELKCEKYFFNSWSVN
jgi:hypothetical protein